ncbi:hypothetical protein [Exiguobacterium sp. s168]|uniref:hypothetical protein n=1 Tax=Exiguobacterium sp. s168 TaxID=2751194 RepID=UPI001BE9C8DD|nr:hypothetical protein [Exiguobacterium sp. s168]
MDKEFDPYDLDGKREIHPKADAKNFLDVRQGKVVLRCGARKKKKDGLCKSIAGAGTNHSGYGRCKYCGGNNTGPKTEEGRQKSAQNARKHGLYAGYLTPDDRETYEDLLKQKENGLKEEIALWRTKLVSYMKYVGIQRQARGEKGLFRTMLRKGAVIEYKIGSVEDPHVHRALEQIRRLVATDNALNVRTDDDILDEINRELRKASMDQSKDSWSGPAQDVIYINEIKE